MMTDIPTGTDGSSRPAPRIISVPSPKGLFITPRLIAIIAIVLLALGLVTLCLGMAMQFWLLWVGPPSMLGAGVLVWWGTRYEKQYKQRRRAYVESVRDRSKDSVAADIAANWKGGGGGVSNEDVKAVIASTSAGNPVCAHVVCLGSIDVPEVGQVYFEPEIIAPTRYLGYQLIFVPIALGLIAFWLLQVTGVIPLPPVPLGSFGYILGMGVGLGVMWVWRTILRPTYIRMAPGIIQILEYRYGHAKPLVRGYPMDYETLAILRGNISGKKKRLVSLTLMRREQRDKIEIWRVRGREAVTKYVWQALLSTAPTPPLSDEELVG